MPHNRYADDPNRLFKSAAPTHSLPPRFSITDANSFLHALAEASAAHRVSRFNSGTEPLTSTEEGGSLYSVTPAGSEDELREQIALLSRTFEEAEGHPPSSSDDNFWLAVNELIDAYDGPEIHNSEDVMGGLS